MIQTILQFPAVTLLRVLLGVLLAFVILPTLVLSRPTSARTTLDVVVVRSVRWLGLALLVSHLLVIVRLFHIVPIVMLCVLLRSLERQRTQSLTVESSGPPGRLEGVHASPAQRLWLGFTDIAFAFEQGGRAVLSEWWRATTVRIGRSLRAVVRVRTLRIAAIVLPIVTILGVSLGLRVEQAFRFETLSPPESYVYLAWAKSFAANQLYVDGLSPMGLPAFIAFLSKLTPGIDMYEIVRYTGAIIGMLTVSGIFYAALRLTANVGAALFASGVFGLFGTVYEWNQPWFRQTGPLPQELGLAVALFVLPSVVLAISERDPDHLRTVAFGSIAIGLIHPVSLALFLVMAIVGAIGTSFYTRNSGRSVLHVGAAGLLGAAISHLYLPVGLLAGLDLYRGLEQPFRVTVLDGSRDQQLMSVMGTSSIGHTELSMVSAGGCVLALLVALGLLRSRHTNRIGAQLAGLAVMGLMAALLYDPRWLPIPTNVLGPLGNMAGVSLTIGLAAGFAALTAAMFASRRPVLRTGVVIVIAAVGVGAFGMQFERGPRTRIPSEYTSMAAATREIMRNQDAFTYTIVGTPQQRQAVSGIGAFIDLWVFARDVTVRDAQDPGFIVPDVASLLFAADLGQSLPIPTSDTYFFVEKVPFPVPEQPPIGPTEEYYYDHEKRGRIMAAVYAWAEFYRYYHTDMTVFFEDDEVIVYQIRRRPNPVAAAAAPQFKDYTWQPGVLFTGGPADPSEVVIPWRR